MREEYDIKNLNPRANPYAKSLKRSARLYIDENVINYFKEESNNVGVPYQTLINMYLRDCMTHERHLSWE